jgi:antitoxin component of MazEF toxin-antitoxin module
MLFHRDVGFPKNVQMMTGVLNLRYSQHALRAAREDRYGIMELPETLDVTNGKPVEIEVEDGRVVKSVYRASYDDEIDMVIVVQPDGFVKTVWFNMKTDKHKTLDRSKYTKP